MRQAITTKYFGPTSVRGPRVKATCQAGSKTISWNHRLNSDENHIVAAQALASHFGWHGRWVGGADSASGYCFVLDLGDARDGFTVDKSKEAA